MEPRDMPIGGGMGVMGVSALTCGQSPATMGHRSHWPDALGDAPTCSIEGFESPPGPGWSDNGQHAGH